MEAWVALYAAQELASAPPASTAFNVGMIISALCGFAVFQIWFRIKIRQRDERERQRRIERRRGTE